MIITLSNGKRVDLSKPYDLIDLNKEEFSELLKLVRAENELNKAA